MPGEPVSVLLSRLLLAFTIELDNEFERRMAVALPDRPFRVSLVMWSNFLRFVGAGIPAGELPAASGLPKARVLSTLGGMERWGYVFVAPAAATRPPAARRDGYGSARGVKPEWLVRPAAAGLAAQELWPPLLDEIEERWHARFGREAVGELRAACLELHDERLPEYLPVVTGANGMVTEVAGEIGRASTPAPLSALLAQVLLVYTQAFEQRAPLSLPLAETVVRALGTEEVDVRELPRLAAVSPEAVAMALTFLTRRGYAEGKKSIRLTPAGLAARQAAFDAHPGAEQALGQRRHVDRLRAAKRAILDQRDGTRLRLALGLEPYPEGWRASGRYLAQTNAMLADPVTGLPRHPLVLHRGGWPDGS